MRPPALVLASLRAVSPRHRRWRRLLRELTLDPDALPRPLVSPGPQDFIICGCPRSGTTLMAAVLFQPPTVITVSEPWDGLRMSPADLFASLRHEIDTTGTLRRGRLNVDSLARGRVEWCRDGESAVPVHAVGDYLLGVKWPAYWRYVDLLPETKFVVCVRDPIEVVDSCREHGGRIGVGLDYDVAFNRTMNRHLETVTTDPVARRFLLYEYINARLLPHLERPNVFVARYERWFTEPERLVAELGSFLGRELGRGRAKITARKPRGAPPPESIELVRRHCPSARALRYAPLAERSESAP